MLRRFTSSTKPSNNSIAAFSRFCSAAAAAVTPSITSRQDLNEYKKKAHALFVLKNTPHLCLSSEAAIQLITGVNNIATTTTTTQTQGNEQQQQQQQEPIQGSLLIPKSERMTRDEAKQFLRDCHSAGIVTISPAPSLDDEAEGKSTTKKTQQLVITDPCAVFHAFQHKNTLDFVSLSNIMFQSAKEDRSYSAHLQLKPHKNLLLREMNAAAESKNNNNNSNESQQNVGISESNKKNNNNISSSSTCGAAVLATDADEVVVAAQKAHSRFWAWISLGLSSQLLLFAYWTFIVYGWDVMEPFTYFVGCGYMILFFVYFVRTKRGYSFGELDKIVLSRVVKDKMVIVKM